MSWKTYIDENKDRFVQELIKFISIPSVSASDDHFQDVVKAGDWVMSRLSAAGLKNAKMMTTETHPVVYADWLEAGSEKPTILIYGHFDVQPADPIDMWDNDPFQPIIKDQRIYGRGASDDKGNMLAPILAIEAFLRSEGSLPVNIKVFFEGQEEIGSPTLAKFVRENSNLLKADMIFSADGGQFGEFQPSLVKGLKGLTGCEVTVTGAKGDQHSGKHGGGIANPLHALSHLIASMKDIEGKIKIKGFYDDVVDLKAEDRHAISLIPFNEEEYAKQLGVPETFGEPDYSTAERLAARPTLEINGMWGGYQGSGIKTVLPAKAYAKITCRIVANQEPKKIFELIKRHIEENMPRGVKVDVVRLSASANPFLIPRGHNATDIVRKVLRDLYGQEPIETYEGGSIPVMSMLLKELGIHGAVLSFGLDDEQVHAPNEFFRLSSFTKAQIAYGSLLEEFKRI